MESIKPTIVCGHLSFHLKWLLVACTPLYNPLCPSVRRLVGHVLVFYDFISLTPLRLPKWSYKLKYGPCPPTRDFGGRVSGLVFFIAGNYGPEAATWPLAKVAKKGFIFDLLKI